MAAEKRQLVANPKLILDVIRRQAGTIEKAILEGVMNAIEAGSPVINITLEADGIEANAKGARLIIEDQGKGFRSEQEIHEWFETFGTPHDESENKIWAQFRMGRGQCFAFGKNVWRTGEFEMTVDVKTMGIEYELETGLSHFGGCRIVIDLYNNPIGSWNYKSVDALKSAIKKHVEFMEGIINFNGEQINTPASGLKWDMEDDAALYMFGKGQNLSFYNLGAYVMEHSATRAGVTGVIVSKEQLKVNFARNDIQHDCSIYAIIQEVIRENRVKKIRKKRRSLNRNERMSMLCDLRDGSVEYNEVKALGLIELSNDKVVSLDTLRKTRTPWTFADHGNRIADRLQYSEAAVCLNEELMDELDFSGDGIDFFDWLLKESYQEDFKYGRGNLAMQWQKMKLMFREFKGSGGGGGLADGYKDVRKRIPQDKWTKAEKRIIKALEGYNCWDGRIICLGTSDTALAWTDGRSYICVAREYLKAKPLTGIHGASHLVMTMFHEMAHTCDTQDTHHHGMEFYRNFHNIVAGEGSYYSPTIIMADLPIKLRKLRSEDYQTDLERKEAKAKAKRDKALGLADRASAARANLAAKVDEVIETYEG